MASVHIKVLPQAPTTVSHSLTFQPRSHSRGWRRESEKGKTHGLRSELFNN